MPIAITVLRLDSPTLEPAVFPALDQIVTAIRRLAQE